MNIKEYFKKRLISAGTYFAAAGKRAVKTMAQAALGAIGTSALLLKDVNWAAVASTGALAAILSLLMSLAGLPEIKAIKAEEKKITTSTVETGKEDKK